MKVFRTLTKFPKKSPIVFKIPSSLNLARRQFCTTNGFTIEELSEMSPLDVEKELHRIRRECNNYFMNGQYQHAFDSAKDLHTKIYHVMGKENTPYASALNNMALAQKMLGQYEESIDNYLHALEVYGQTSGDKSLSYAATLSNLGVAFKEYSEKAKGMDKINLMDRAKEALADAYKLRVEINAPIRDVIMSRNQLASLDNIEKNYNNAIEKLKTSLEECLEKIGEKDRLTATTMNNLAYAIKLKGDSSLYNDAEQMYLKAWSIRQELLGDMHPDTVVTMNNLAELYAVLGKVDEANAIQQRIVELFGQVAEGEEGTEDAEYSTKSDHQCSNHNHPNDSKGDNK